MTKPLFLYLKYIFLFENLLVLSSLIQNTLFIYAAKLIIKIFRVVFNFKDAMKTRAFLHFSARMVTREVVRNTCFGRFGKVEKNLTTPFPLKYNVPFLVSVSKKYSLSGPLVNMIK